jgi:hypothetical protein
MKKIVLTLAAATAAIAVAPEASAIPAFARQTGMACTACHQQHFPILNGFGRAFKAAGYTMMGAQEVVEGEHLSIPSSLNAAMVLKVRYQKDGTPAVVGGGTVAANGLGNGQLQFPDEFALLFGGRVTENIGFLLENAVVGANVAGGMGLGFKMPILFDMGGAKVGVVPFTTDALGVAYGYELGSAGTVANIRWAEHRNEIAAQGYIGTNTAATGFALVGQNDMGYANLSMFNQGIANGGFKMGSTYIRLAATPTIGDWDTHFGIQSWSGSSSATPTLLGAGAMMDTRATALDFQAFGKIGENDIGVYSTYARAGASTLAAMNAYNAGMAEARFRIHHRCRLQRDPSRPDTGCCIP